MRIGAAVLAGGRDLCGGRRVTASPTAMPSAHYIIGERALTSYKLTYDKDIIDELRKRFTSEIVTIEKEGFKFSSVHQEITYPFSVLISFPVYIAMLMGGEIIQIQSPLRIASFHIMFASQTHATYTYIYGLGCKFYTNFTDGTWLVSNTHLKIKDKTVIILESDAGVSSTDKIWERHQEKISELEAKGKHLNHHISFDTWLKLEQQFNRSSMFSFSGVEIIWFALILCAFYWLISNLIALVRAG